MIEVTADKKEDKNENAGLIRAAVMTQLQAMSSNGEMRKLSQKNMMAMKKSTRELYDCIDHMRMCTHCVSNDGNETMWCDAGEDVACCAPLGCMTCEKFEKDVR